ncbi:C40 family peptidase [Nonomuraea gerenzanensis]|uniref:NlpC/P60 domain-containing protein n=1 Tax=Nonomuraea gerenzanensis TaxID=93944 RepID=A0A1M4EAC4_9ACTN|nr:C40 family peptidase [Nonomuraea gerenzanensis]UBU17909.1 C40 family peptidase [Nonomuraea gerenzanensis]SBO95704.1 hypothetical protein BN4615_P5220 [Nonomuraea gerenzanensis]
MTEHRISNVLAPVAGLVSGVALVAGMTGGTAYATVSMNPDRPNSTLCGYASRSGTSPRGLSAQQTDHARVIVETAAELGLPRRAAEIALATAFQESRLNNDAVSAEGRSFGLFQQTPAAGWGTRKQVTTPRHAARSFYERLVRVRGWQAMPLTKAAALVQRPRQDLRGKYAEHEPLAKQLASALWTPSATDADLETLDLTSKEQARIQRRLTTAAGLGISRETVISGLADDLRQKDDAADDAADESADESAATAREQAEAIVDDITGRLCGAPDNSTTTDGSTTTDDSTTTSGSATGDTDDDAATGSGGAAAAVDAALTQRGIPYSWGGGGPSGPSYGIGRGADIKGFDCSGLTEYAWSKAGIRIGGTTYEQVNKGRKVSRAEVRPGDLVFYDTDTSRPGPDHVGLAVSNTQMVNAPSTGAVVRLDAIDRRSYLTAVRPSAEQPAGGPPSVPAGQVQQR